MQSASRALECSALCAFNEVNRRFRHATMDSWHRRIAADADQIDRYLITAHLDPDFEWNMLTDVWIGA
jgi:hypothetical protein